MSKSRDVAGDYKAALIEEYTAYSNAGRAADAAGVAAVLKDVHGYSVGKTDEPAEPPVERAVPDESEIETPEKSEAPVKRGPGRPRKTAE